MVASFLVVPILFKRLNHNMIYRIEHAVGAQFIEPFDGFDIRGDINHSKESHSCPVSSTG
jgi:hypothetical protein